MQHLLRRLRALSKPAGFCLQLGLGSAVLLLFGACCLLLQAGTFTSADLPLHLLARRLDSAAKAVLFVTVFATGFLEEHRTT